MQQTCCAIITLRCVQLCRVWRQASGRQRRGAHGACAKQRVVGSRHRLTGAAREAGRELFGAVRSCQAARTGGQQLWCDGEYIGGRAQEGNVGLCKRLMVASYMVGLLAGALQRTYGSLDFDCRSCLPQRCVFNLRWSCGGKTRISVRAELHACDALVHKKMQHSTCQSPAICQPSALHRQCCRVPNCGRWLPIAPDPHAEQVINSAADASAGTACLYLLVTIPNPKANPSREPPAARPPSLHIITPNAKCKRK